MKFLADPNIINYVILALYVLNVARWIYQRSPADICYWVSALGIQFALTFLYKH